MVRVVEDDDCVATGCVTGDLDCVLDSFCAGVEQHGTLLVVTGGEFGETLGDLDVALVRSNHETGVGEVCDLILNCGHDGRVGSADAGHRDTGTEVDQRVAVDVDDDSTVCVGDVDRKGGCDAGADDLLTAFGERSRARARELRDDATLLRKPVFDCTHVTTLSVVYCIRVCDARSIASTAEMDTRSFGATPYRQRPLALIR